MNEFWAFCAEEANKAVRANFHCNEIFRETYDFYRICMMEMEEEMFKTKTNKDMIIYRNVCFDPYNDKEEGDIFEEQTFLSCYTNGFNTKYGDVQLKILIPKGCFHLKNENIIIIPSGVYEFVRREEKNYVLKLVKAKKIFE